MQDYSTKAGDWNSFLSEPKVKNLYKSTKAQRFIEVNEKGWVKEEKKWSGSSEWEYISH